jgi:hypothetical protein
MLGWFALGGARAVRKEVTADPSRRASSLSSGAFSTSDGLEKAPEAEGSVTDSSPSWLPWKSSDKTDGTEKDASSLGFEIVLSSMTASRTIKLVVCIHDDKQGSSILMEHPFSQFSKSEHLGSYPGMIFNFKVRVVY